MKRVLVTGASGFVGRALCQRLVQHGWHVRAAVREFSSALAVLPSAVEAHAVGDFERDPDWTSALAGVDVVMHLAARVPLPGAEPTVADYQSTNVDATAWLAEAVSAQGIKRLVFTSSIKVYGERSPDRAIRVNDPLAPADAYARSKLAAEQALSRVLGGGATELVIVRPPVVYGPGAGGNFLRLTEAVLSDRWLPVGALQARRSMVCVDGLCELLERAAEHPQAVGAPLLVADPQDLTVAELAQCLGGLLGHPPRLLPVPATVLRIVGLLTGRGDEVRRLCEPLQVDTSDTRARLGWQPLDPSVCLQETVSWLSREQGNRDDA